MASHHGARQSHRIHHYGSTLSHLPTIHALFTLRLHIQSEIITSYLPKLHINQRSLKLQFFSIKMMEGIIATSYSAGEKFYINRAKLFTHLHISPSTKGAIRHVAKQKKNVEVEFVGAAKNSGSDQGVVKNILPS